MKGGLKVVFGTFAASTVLMASGQAIAATIVLTNDDGYQAEGISVLFDRLTAAGHQVTLVAPKTDQSGIGTAIDASRIFRPIEVVNFAPNQWYVDSTPTLATWAALDFILQGNKPDLVVSGINRGENVGFGAVSSGTVSAAVAALYRDVPAIAISAGVNLSESQTGFPSTSLAYETGADYLLNLIAGLEATQGSAPQLLPQGVGLNINVPVVFPPGVNGIQGTAYTRFDRTESLDFSFGPLPATFGGGVGLRVAPSILQPGVITNPESEGEQFLAGNLTITPIDGNWTADAAIRQQIRDRLITTPVGTATPLSIMLVNDDGYQAEGLAVLANALIAAGHNVTVVAPKVDQSGVGTSFNASQVFRPIETVNYAPDRWYVNGTPTLATWAGLDFILQNNRPDLVISGINRGENIGPVANSSGTVSAAVAALFYEIPAIAVSAGLNLGESATGFPSTSQAYGIGASYIVDLIAQLQASQGSEATLLPRGTGLNVNIPVTFPPGVNGIQGIAFTELDRVTPLNFDFGPLPAASGGGVGLRFAPSTVIPGVISNPASEGEQFLAGYITVTALDGDWTASAALRQQTNDRLTAAAIPEPTTITGSLVAAALFKAFRKRSTAKVKK